MKTKAIILLIVSFFFCTLLTNHANADSEEPAKGDDCLTSAPRMLFSSIVFFSNYTVPPEDYDGTSSFGLKFGLGKDMTGRRSDFKNKIWFGTDFSYSRAEFDDTDDEEDETVDCFNMNFYVNIFLYRKMVSSYIGVSPGFYNRTSGTDRSGMLYSLGADFFPGEKRQVGFDFSANYHDLFDSTLDFYELRLGIVLNN
ncbi:hypothetical protein ACFL2A_06800 [Thermodesulfobacteriota bacterium]